MFFIPLLLFYIVLAQIVPKTLHIRITHACVYADWCSVNYRTEVRDDDSDNPDVRCDRR